MAIASANLNPNLSQLFGAPSISAPTVITCTTGAFTAAAQSMFTIAGGPIYGMFVGIVTTPIGGTAMNGTLQEVVTTPSGTVQLSTAVSLISKAAGTSIRFVGTSTYAVLTLVTAGAKIIDPVTVADDWFLLPIGAVSLLTTAINTGLITWSLSYYPLSPDCVVTVT